MRRLNRAFPIAAAALLAGCAAYRPPIVTDETENRPPSSVVDAADKTRAFQLLDGFHRIEYGAWRWTKSRFAIALQPPAGATIRGARLEVNLAIPESIIARRGRTSLAASADGAALGEQAYSKAGEFVYSRDVPAAALASGPVKFEFTVSDYLKPGEADERELGIVFKSAALVLSDTGTLRTPAARAGRQSP